LYVSVTTEPVLLLAPADLHLPDKGGNATTIQFHTMSLNGFGILDHKEYGPRHIATHNHRVNVGARYSLNCDTSHPNIHHAHIGLGGQIGAGITPGVVGKDKIGIHLSSGNKGRLKHPNKLYFPGAKNA